MSDLVGNTEDSFSGVVAHITDSDVIKTLLMWG